MKKSKANPMPLLLALVALIGAIIALTVLNSRNVTVYDDHDHDHDGVSDHAATAHAN